MGLFDKRDKRRGEDDFDSPVEQIDLSAPPVVSGVVNSAPPEPEQLATGTHEVPTVPAAHYGIEQAIQLMRTLPSDNVELVVQVVKHTLESTNIRIRAIIDDASRRQGDIESRIKILKGEIGEFEAEIAVRREEIRQLETDHKETSTVKDRLMLAENLTAKGDRAATTPSSPPGTGIATAAPPSTRSSGEYPAASRVTSSGGANQATSKGTIVAKK
jgi:hypothetical protein